MPAALSLLAALPFVAALVAADRPDDPARREQGRFRGAWRVVAVKTQLGPGAVSERRGAGRVTGPGLEGAKRHAVEGVTLTFADGKLTVTNPGKMPGMAWLGAVEYAAAFDPSRTPKVVTFTPQGKNLPDDVRAFAAIYLLDGDELWVCTHGDRTPPRDFDLDVTIASVKEVWVLRREPGAKK